MEKAAILKGLFKCGDILAYGLVCLYKLSLRCLTLNIFNLKQPVSVEVNNLVMVSLFQRVEMCENNSFVQKWPQCKCCGTHINCQKLFTISGCR